MCNMATVMKHQCDQWTLCRFFPQQTEGRSTGVSPADTDDASQLLWLRLCQTRPGTLRSPLHLIHRLGRTLLLRGHSEDLVSI